MLEHGLPLYYWGWGSWGVAFFSFLAGIAATYLYFKWKKEPAANPDRESSLQILKSRFAKGEISQEDFEKMKGVLLS